VVVVVVLEVVDEDGDVVAEVLFDAGRPVVGVVARLAAGLPAGAVAVGRGVVVLSPAGVEGVVVLSARPVGAVGRSASLG
jgi:hypothetical protein